MFSPLSLCNVKTLSVTLQATILFENGFGGNEMSVNLYMMHVILSQGNSVFSYKTDSTNL